MFLIAKNTIKEFLRNKLIRLIFFCWIVFLVLAIFVGKLTIAESGKIINDFSYFFIEWFGILIILFFGTSLIYNEQKRKTLNLILSKDHSGIKFILWKFFGFATVLFIFLVSIGLFFLVINLFFVSQNLSIVFLIIFSIYIKLLILLSIVMFFSVFTSQVVSIVSGLIIYLISHSIAFIKYYFVSHSTNFSFTKYIFNFIYYILPDFQAIDFKEYLNNPIFAEKITSTYIFTSIGVQILYIFVILFFTIIIFRKRYCKF